MNVKLLRKIKRHILEEPKRLFMRTYITRKTFETEKLCTWNGRRRRNYAQCGTAACISGWASILSGWDHANLTIGKDLLELKNFDEALRLFEPSSWPKQFHAGLSDDGRAKTAKVAAARIEHFIKTKGAE